MYCLIFFCNKISNGSVGMKTRNSDTIILRSKDYLADYTTCRNNLLSKLRIRQRSA